MVNIRLKNQGCYHTIKGQLCQISGFIGDEERGMKESLKTLLINHRRCLASRAICPHLETLLSHIKGVDT